MPFPVPTAMQYPWDVPLVNHLSQLMDTTTGGINNWATRPTTGVDGNALGATHEGYTGYNTTTGKLERWDGSQWEEVASGLGSWDDTSKPSNPEEGDIGYNSDLPGLEFYDGSQWQPISGGGSTCSWDSLTELNDDTTLSRAEKQCYYASTLENGSWTLTLPSNPQIGDEIQIQGDESLTSGNLLINPNNEKFQGGDIESDHPVMLGSYNIGVRLVYKDTESGWVTHPYIPNPGESFEPEPTTGSGGPGGISDEDLWFWGDVTDTSTITESAGNISSWSSKVGTVSFDQGNASDQPSYITTGGVNNGPSIFFPGGTTFKRLDSSETFTGDNITCFIVYKPHIVNGQHRHLINRGGTTNYYKGQSDNFTIRIDDRYRTNTVGIRSPVSSLLSYPNNYLNTTPSDVLSIITRNPAEMKLIDSQTGGIITQLQPKELHPDQIMRIGCHASRRSPNLSRYYQYHGHISEFIFYERVLSTSEINSVRTYLNSKYNL